MPKELMCFSIDNNYTKINLKIDLKIVGFKCYNEKIIFATSNIFFCSNALENFFRVVLTDISQPTNN